MEGIKISNKEYRQKPGMSSSDLNEEWRDIRGYDGRYQVSNLGRVRSLYIIVGTHGKKVKVDKIVIFKPGYCGRDRLYKCVGLEKNGKRIRHRVHRLVAEAFIPNPNNYEQVDHINRNTKDNRADNLRWCNQEINMRNRNYNIFLTLNGETKLLVEWAKEIGISYATLKYRIQHGWSDEKALTTPLMNQKEAR